MRLTYLFCLMLGMHWLPAQSILQSDSAFKITSQKQLLDATLHQALSHNLKEFKTYKFNQAEFNRFVKAKRERIDIILELEGWPKLEIVLEENDLRAPDYQAYQVTDKGTEKLPSFPCPTYKGYSKTHGQELRMALNETTWRALIPFKAEIYRIEPISHFGLKGNQYVAFRESDLIYPETWACTVVSESSLKPINESTKNVDGCPIEAEIATDADYEYSLAVEPIPTFQMLSDLNFAEMPFLSDFNMKFVVTYQRYFSTPNDPYTQLCVNAASTQCDNVINELRSIWNNGMGHVRRDLMHLFSGKNHGAFGHVGNNSTTLGTGVGAVCENPDRAYGFTKAFPNSYKTTAHEIAHNFDGNHNDALNCSPGTATLMCTGGVEQNLVFSNASKTRIGNFINSIDCVDPCHNTISSFPYQEGFESGFGDWIQGPLHDFDWRRKSGGTTSVATGPSSAYEGNYYVYVEASYPNNPNKETVLWGPCFDLSNLSNPVLQFRYHMWGHNNMGGLKVMVKSSGCTMTEIFNKSGNQGNQWRLANLDLSAYAGQTIQLQMIGTTKWTYQGDIAVDDIILTNTCPSNIDIVENIPACYPSFYPHGRYTLTNTSAGNVQWSGNNINIIGSSSNPVLVVAPTSVGWFTINASINCGNGGSLFLSKNYYADACGFPIVDDTETEKQFKIYPNPVVDQLQIEVPATKKSLILKIIDLNGSVRLEMTIKEGYSSITVQQLPQGTYHIEMKNSDYHFRSQFFKK